MNHPHIATVLANKSIVIVSDASILKSPVLPAALAQKVVAIITDPTMIDYPPILDADKIRLFVHLRELPQQKHAHLMLREIARLVEPIMIRRNYRVGCLVEYWTPRPDYFGLNMRSIQRILIRLRRWDNALVFLPLGNCIATMLHELAHNVYGPHDENFYKLLREHREEYTAIYHSEPSRKLGVGSPGDVINLAVLERRESLQYSLQNNLT